MECEVKIVDEVKVNKVGKQLDAMDFSSGAIVFKALADETRLKIIYALMLEDELCVCDIAAIIGSTNATASHHLRLLRNLGLATDKRKGKLVYYSLKSTPIKNLLACHFDVEKEAI